MLVCPKVERLASASKSTDDIESILKRLSLIVSNDLSLCFWLELSFSNR